MVNERKRFSRQFTARKKQGLEAGLRRMAAYEIEKQAWIEQNPAATKREFDQAMIAVCIKIGV